MGGAGQAVGGRDNFSGTYTNAYSHETVWSGAQYGDWYSDYDGQKTADWQVTFEPDGTFTGWAIYPAG